MEEGWKEIGVVGVDSGQLVITDPCYIDSQWEKEEFNDNTEYIFVFPDGKEEKVEHCSERWFELIDDVNSGKIKLKEKRHPPNPEHPFSYNACCQETLQKSFGQLLFKMGHEGVGVVFNSGIGDGVYPVYAFFKNIGTNKEPDFRIAEVRIVMLEDENAEKVELMK
jgi:hypothetical protein